MKVKDLMSTNIRCISEDTPVHLISLYMKKNDVGCMPVCDDAGHVLGIVTDRDIVLRVCADENKSETETTAAEIMTLNPVTVSSNTNIHNAALLFSAHKIRRLPVTEASRLVGMLSLGDIASKPVYVDEAGDALSAISSTTDLQTQS